MTNSSITAESVGSSSAVASAYRWEIPDKPIAVHLSLDVVDRMEREVLESFKAVTKRGSEIGGLLLGRAVREAKSVVSVEQYALVECEYSRGPLYLLADADRQRMRDAIARWRTPGEDLSIVGFFRSNTRKDLTLDEDDQAVVREFFSDPAHVFLLVKPFAMKPSVAGFHFWEDGQVRAESHLQFPFRRSELMKVQPQNIIGAAEKPSGPVVMPKREDRMTPLAAKREDRLMPPPPGARREEPPPVKREEPPVSFRREERAPVVVAPPKREEPAPAPKPEQRQTAAPPTAKREEPPPVKREEPPVSFRREERPPVVVVPPKREEPAPAPKPEQRQTAAPPTAKREEPPAVKREEPGTTARREERQAPLTFKREERPAVTPIVLKREERPQAAAPAPKREEPAPRKEERPAVTLRREERPAPAQPKVEPTPAARGQAPTPSPAPPAASTPAPAPPKPEPVVAPAPIAPTPSFAPVPSTAEPEMAEAAAPGFFARLRPIHWIVVGLLVAVLVAAGFLYRTLRPAGSSKTGEDTLGLTIERNSGQFLLKWNRNATLIVTAQRATLSVSDGDHKEDVDLDLGQLRSGSIVYSPITSDVSFRLEVTDLKRGKSLSESVRWLAGRPSPSVPMTPSAPQGAPAPAVTTTPTPAAPAPGSAKPMEQPTPAASNAPPLTPEPARPQGLPTVTAQPPKPLTLAARLSAPVILDAPNLDNTSNPLASGRSVLSGSLPSAPPPEAPKPPAAQPVTQPAAAQAKPPAPQASKSAEGPKVGGNVREATVLRRVQPVYPPLARQARVSGAVRVEATIGKDGRVRSATALSGPPLLRQAAVDAVSRWTYQPSTLNGEPVEAVTQVDVTFNLGR